VSATLNSQPCDSFPTRALRLLTEEGHLSTSRAARLMIDRGIVTEDELETIQWDGLVSKIGKAWRTRDAEGLPRAGMMTIKEAATKEPIWATRPMWDADAYVANIAERFDGRDENHLGGMKLCAEMKRRFGWAPEPPPLPTL
jgi:hypothetical protein